MSDKLTELTQLSEKLIEAEAQVVEAEEALKKSKESARQLREEHIPALMSELGVVKFKLEGGGEVSVKEDVRIELTNAGKPAAYQWLEENDYGGLIKTEVSIAFGKGDLEKAVFLAEDLRLSGHTVDLTRDVHWQTLAAFLREQIAEARPCPLDLFGAKPVKTAKVKLPTKKGS